MFPVSSNEGLWQLVLIPGREGEGEMELALWGAFR